MTADMPVPRVVVGRTILEAIQVDCDLKAVEQIDVDLRGRNSQGRIELLEVDTDRSLTRDSRLGRSRAHRVSRGITRRWRKEQPCRGAGCKRRAARDYAKSSDHANNQVVKPITASRRPARECGGAVARRCAGIICRSGKFHSVAPLTYVLNTQVYEATRTASRPAPKRCDTIQRRTYPRKASMRMSSNV